MAVIDNDATSLVPSPATTAPAPRLLVIDDDIVLRGIIRKVGERAGYSIAEAASYDEAAKLLQKERFDCITLDLSLGRNYGLEVIHLLVEMSCTTPVIVISGVGESIIKLSISIGRMKRLNVCEPIHKPVDFALLKGILARIKEDGRRQGAAAQPDPSRRLPEPVLSRSLWPRL
jgi:DNA-binding NtrC family response regulator